MKKLVFVLFLFTCFSSVAQFDQSDEVWLIGGERELLPYQNKLKPDFSFDARRTLFKNRWVLVGGLKFGVEYKRIHRLGIGVYFLNTRIFDDEVEFILEANKIEYDFGYSTLYYDRVLYFNKKWEVGGTLHLGGGKVKTYYQNELNPNERNTGPELNFSVAEFVAYGEYNVLYWLGLSAGLGYRQVFGLEYDLGSDFSSAIFVINLRLNLIKLARSYFDESVKDEF
ncbi:hypothetical protein O3Q51_18170 [Cryomorphaceae bacterium 1068]|nr:hypothetical protein [Cryomorphaceae bacterium 1068]